jgi:hypothetical protein
LSQLSDGELVIKTTDVLNMEAEDYILFSGGDLEKGEGGGETGNERDSGMEGALPEEKMVGAGVRYHPRVGRNEEKK